MRTTTLLLTNYRYTSRHPSAIKEEQEHLAIQKEFHDCLKRVSLEDIEKGWKAENRVYKKHAKIPRDKKIATNNKYYTILPKNIVSKQIEKWHIDILNRYKKKQLTEEEYHKRNSIPELQHNILVECPSKHIDDLALPILKTYKDKKRCPIKFCDKTKNKKGKECYLNATWSAGHLKNIITNKRSIRVPYTLLTRTCKITNEPYFCETIFRTLVIEVTDFNNPDLINPLCPQCSCASKKNFKRGENDAPIFEEQSFEILGYKTYHGGFYHCKQCGYQFEVYLIPPKAFDKLEEKKHLLSQEKYELFKQYMKHPDQLVMEEFY